MENHSYDEIIGSSSAPYLNGLARRYGLATNYHGVTHPSLPNYLAMIGGSTFGISSDCTSCSVDATNLGDQLDAKGVAWRGYFEGMPSPCYQGASYGSYAKKHDPFVYFRDISSDASRCRAHVVPLGSFGPDLSGRSTPGLSFIVPNLCNDMHDCSVATGDSWLRSFVPPILASAAFKDGGTLVITFDEDNGSSANHIMTLVISRSIRSGARTSANLNHYSLLRAIEGEFGASPLREAASARSLFAAFGLP